MFKIFSFYNYCRILDYDGRIKQVYKLSIDYDFLQFTRFNILAIDNDNFFGIKLTKKLKLIKLIIVLPY
jgi:hypothetical protein